MADSECAPVTTNAAAQLDPVPAQLLTYRDVAEVLAIDVSTLRRWVRAGLIRPVMLTPRTIRFRPQDVAAFIDGRARLAGEPPTVHHHATGFSGTFA